MSTSPCKKESVITAEQSSKLATQNELIKLGSEIAKIDRIKKMKKELKTKSNEDMKEYIIKDINFEYSYETLINNYIDNHFKNYDQNTKICNREKKQIENIYKLLLIIYFLNEENKIQKKEIKENEDLNEFNDDIIECLNNDLETSLRLKKKWYHVNFFVIFLLFFVNNYVLIFGFYEMIYDIGFSISSLFFMILSIFTYFYSIVCKTFLLLWTIKPSINSLLFFGFVYLIIYCKNKYDKIKKD